MNQTTPLQSLGEGQILSNKQETKDAGNFTPIFRPYYRHLVVPYHLSMT
jgi:hypothetical protein